MKDFNIKLYPNLPKPRSTQSAKSLPIVAATLLLPMMSYVNADVIVLEPLSNGDFEQTDVSTGEHNGITSWRGDERRTRTVETDGEDQTWDNTAGNESQIAMLWLNGEDRTPMNQRLRGTSDVNGSTHDLTTAETAGQTFTLAARIGIESFDGWPRSHHTVRIGLESDRDFVWQVDQFLYTGTKEQAEANNVTDNIDVYLGLDDDNPNGDYILWSYDATMPDNPVSGDEDLVFSINLRSGGSGAGRGRVTFDDMSITLNQTVADDDGDGLTDAEEETLGTLPGVADTDGDGVDDGVEVVLGFSPTESSSKPVADAELISVNTVGAIGRFLNDNLPSATPGGITGDNWVTEDYFTSLSNFNDLKGVVTEPNSSFIAAIERRGTIQRVDANNRTTNSRQQTLDIRDRIVNGDNGGLRSVVFHPNFNQPGEEGEHYIYCFYSTEARNDIDGFTAPYLRFEPTNDDYFFYRLSRFTRNPNTGVFDTNSELVMIQQASRDRGQHFGGGLAFGIDGFLNIAFGDLEFRNDRVDVPFYQDNQRIDRIFQAALLRIDVDMKGGAISSAPTRTLQGNTGPRAMPGTSQSCVADDPIYGPHNYYHHDNFSGVGYYIPNDNYFVLNPPASGQAETSPAYPAHGPALGEHHALGLRNPWRISADPVTGDIAVFNVGGNGRPHFEEVEIIKPSGGSNHGWAYTEGDVLKEFETNRTVPTGGQSYAPVFLGTEVPPLTFWEDNSGNGTVASGGLYYRGSQWINLSGTLIAADHGSGKIWSIDYLNQPVLSTNTTDTDGVEHPDNVSVVELIDTNIGIRQMSASPNGQDIFIAGNSNIWLLRNTGTANPQPPTLLSDTGAFSNTENLTPVEGMIAYEPEAPLWSDRAKKPRWMAIPNDVAGVDGSYDTSDEQIVFSEEGEWVFPTGTVFVKQFTLPLDERDPDNPALQKRLETRFGVRGDDGEYFFFTYKWNSSDTEATLVNPGDTSALDETYTIIDKNGNSFQQTWNIPTRAECLDCHQTGAGSVLAVKTRQLNNLYEYPESGENAHQLATLNELGIFNQKLSLVDMADYLSSKNIGDKTVSLETRVHSYLDSNCSHCHRPESNAGQADFDVRLSTPMSLTGIINGDVLAGELGLDNPKLIIPGDFLNSMIYHRDESIDPEFRMPIIGKSITDDEYITVLRSWIERKGLPNFDDPDNPNGPGRLVIGGPNDDDDGDGRTNKEEYLFQTDPLSPDFGQVFRIFEEDGHVKVEFSLNGDALEDGLDALLKDSIDLSAWFEAGTAQSALTLDSDTSSPGVDGVRTWKFEKDAQTGFLRLQVAP